MKKQYSIGSYKDLTIVDLIVLASHKPKLFRKDHLKIVLDAKEKLINELYENIRKGL